MKLSARFAALLVGGLLLLPALASAKAADEDVEIVDSGEMMQWGYSPTSLTVTAGTSVTWNNDGTLAHSVTSQDQLFDSRLMDSGKSWSYTFDTPGTFRYFCVPHPWMKGTIVVVRATPPIKAEEPAPRASESVGPSSPTSTPTAQPSPTASAAPTSSPSAGNPASSGTAGLPPSP